MNSSSETPGWLTEGAVVSHDTFGTGVLTHVGEYRGLPSVWIDFDYGERKGLLSAHAIPHLSPHRRWRRRTPRQADMQCGTCGETPVVLNVDGQRFCEIHTPLQPGADRMRRTPPGGARRIRRHLHRRLTPTPSGSKSYTFWRTMSASTAPENA